MRILLNQTRLSAQKHGRFLRLYSYAPIVNRTNDDVSRDGKVGLVDILFLLCTTVMC